MRRFNSLSFQSTFGMIAAIILFVLFALGISWGITCLFVYWISLLWANTPFAFDWSWDFATGIWLALALIGGFTSARINVND